MHMSDLQYGVTDQQRSTTNSVGLTCEHQLHVSGARLRSANKVVSTVVNDTVNCICVWTLRIVWLGRMAKGINFDSYGTSQDQRSLTDQFREVSEAV